MSKQSPIKVGDELAGEQRFGGWFAVKVDRITPSGRIVCGHMTLNPDLSVRGRDTWSNLPHRLQRVTPKIKEKILRQQLGAICRKLADEVRWESLSVQTLRGIKELLEAAKEN